MKIGIIGLGKIGGWLARNLSETESIVLYDPSPEARKHFLDEHLAGSWGELAKTDPELIINAVPLSQTIPVFEEISSHLKSNTILCDVCSIKKKVQHFYDSTPHRFISIHPMFGPGLADLENPEGERAIIIEESDASMKDFFSRFFQKQGIITEEMTFGEHDSLMVRSLSLPYFVGMLTGMDAPRGSTPGTSRGALEELTGKILNEDTELLKEALLLLENETSLRDNFHRLLEAITNKSSDDLEDLIGNARKTFFRS